MRQRWTSTKVKKKRTKQNLRNSSVKQGFTKRYELLVHVCIYVRVFAACGVGGGGGGGVASFPGSPLAPTKNNAPPPPPPQPCSQVLPLRFWGGPGNEAWGGALGLQKEFVGKEYIYTKHIALFQSSTN